MRFVLVVLVAAVAFAAVRGGSGGDDDFTPSWVATAKVPEVPIYPLRGAPEPDRRLPSPEGGPLVFLVKPTDGEPVDINAEWLHVYLPVRPNGSGGWVRSQDVTLRRNDYRIAIDLEDHELTLLHKGNLHRGRSPAGTCITCRRLRHRRRKRRQRVRSHRVCRTWARTRSLSPRATATRRRS